MMINGIVKKIVNCLICMLGVTQVDAMSHLIKVDSLEYIEMIPVGSVILNSELKEISENELTGKYVGVFISASWCGPCRYFGKYLKQYTDKYNEEFAVVLIGLDRSENVHNNYVRMYGGTFHALSYNHRPKKEIWGITARAYDRKRGAIPLFVLFNENREFVSFPWSEIKNDVEDIRPFTPWVK